MNSIKYRGFDIEAIEDSDHFYWVIYSPDIDKDLDSKYNKGRNAGLALQAGKKGVDEHLKRRGK